MYTCKYCGKKFEKPQPYSSHTGKCKLNPNRMHSLEHLAYARSCKKDFNEKDLTEYTCQYCGKVCIGKNSLTQHEIRCKNNPNRIINHNFVSNFIKYNEDCRNGIRHHPHKGQTKETCESLRKSSETKKRQKENGEYRCSFGGKKHTEESKKKMMEARLRFMKEHPEKTAWRMKNESYPEKVFKKYLEDRGFDKKYLIYREYSVFPYFIDFAFLNEKIAIEIDGSQHLEKDRHEKDIQKEKLLNEEGWTVVRFSDNVVKKSWDVIDKTLTDVLNRCNTTPNVLKVGIITPSKARDKVWRNEDGYSIKEIERQFKQRKVIDRPSLEELETMINEKSFLEIGRMYDVSDNTIRKWCKGYKIPYRKKDLKNKGM